MGVEIYKNDVIGSTVTGLTYTDSLCSFYTGQSWLAWTGYDYSSYANGTNAVAVVDYADKKAYGYFASAGTGLTLGAENVVDGTMESDTDWEDYGLEGADTQARSDEQANGGTYSRKISVDASSEGAFQSIYLVPYKLYYYTVSMYAASGTMRFFIYNSSTGVTACSATNNSAEWVTSSGYFVSSSGFDRVLLLAGSGGGVGYFDDVSIKEVTEPAATGCHVVWTHIDSGFAPQYANQIQFYKIKDIAGNVVDKPYYSERRLGLDFISGDNEADENELLSTALICDLCGIPVKDKDELIEVNGYERCKECIDEE